MVGFYGGTMGVEGLEYVAQGHLAVGFSCFGGWNLECLCVFGSIN